MLILVIAEAAAILLLGLLVAGLLRSHAEILRRLHQLGAGPRGGEEDHHHDVAIGDGPTGGAAGPPIGGKGAEAATGHDVAGVTLGDEVAAVGVVGVSHRTLLAFLSAGCSTCGPFWDAFSEPDRLSLPGGVRLVIVTAGPSQESPSALRRLAPPLMPVVMSDAAWRDYQVPGSPYFVLVDGPSGRVAGEGSAATWEQLDNLLRQALEDGARGPGRQPAGDGYREARADRELEAAGIHPGHPSLYGMEEAEEDE